MSSRFIARPPLPMKGDSLKKYLWQIPHRIGLILWQIVVPFKSRPEEIEGFPEATVKATGPHVRQCQWIFDQAEKRRVRLEDKAQSTFGLMVFLVPLLASLFVFIISKASTAVMAIRTPTICLLLLSACLLLLGFISAVRAVSVKSIETLFLQSVIDEAGQLRNYDKASHARGLLYCAAMNEAMNDHLAQFVKGAHILTAAALIALVVAAVPASFVFSGLPSSPTLTKISGSVAISSTELVGIRNEVANLKVDIEKLLSNRPLAGDDLKLLEEKVAKLDAKLSKCNGQQPLGPGKEVPPPHEK